ncbi:MAG: heavy-metal-associated domain-containing protein [Gelidibacter sp.]|nr:heavy-metal-associated domain-containing protein [Gelidibacter sp.]
MSFLSENVIPGYYGKKFTTDAKELTDLQTIHNALLKLDGIKDVLFEADVYPVVFTIHTYKVVTVDAIEDCVKKLNFHAIPKGNIFML